MDEKLIIQSILCCVKIFHKFISGSIGDKRVVDNFFFILWGRLLLFYWRKENITVGILTHKEMRKTFYLLLRNIFYSHLMTKHLTLCICWVWCPPPLVWPLFEPADAEAAWPLAAAAGWLLDAHELVVSLEARHSSQYPNLEKKQYWQSP